MNRFPSLSPLLAFHLADKATMCDHLISNLSTLSLLVEEASLKDVSFLFIKKIKIMGNHWVESRWRHEWGNQFPRVFPNLVSVSINDFPQNLGMELFKFPLASLEWKRKNINATSEKPLVKALRVALRELTRFSGKILKISLPISKIDVKKWNHSWNLLLNMPHLEELEIEITSHENQEKCLSFWSQLQGNGNGNGAPKLKALRLLGNAWMSIEKSEPLVSEWAPNLESIACAEEVYNKVQGNWVRKFLSGGE